MLSTINLQLCGGRLYSARAHSLYTTTTYVERLPSAADGELRLTFLAETVSSDPILQRLRVVGDNKRCCRFSTPARVVLLQLKRVAPLVTPCSAHPVCGPRCFDHHSVSHARGARTAPPAPAAAFEQRPPTAREVPDARSSRIDAGRKAVPSGALFKSGSGFDCFELDAGRQGCESASDSRMGHDSCREAGRPNGRGPIARRHARDGIAPSDFLTLPGAGAGAAAVCVESFPSSPYSNS